MLQPSHTTLALLVAKQWLKKCQGFCNEFCVGKYKEIHFPNTDGTNWVQWHVEASRPTPNTCRDTDAASVGAHRLLYHASKSPCRHCLLTDEEKGWPSPPRKKNIQKKSGPGSAAANWIWFERLQIAASVWRFFSPCIPTNRNIKTHQPDATKPFALSFITTLVDWWGWGCTKASWSALSA